MATTLPKKKKKKNYHVISVINNYYLRIKNNNLPAIVKTEMVAHLFEQHFVSRKARRNSN